MNATEELRRMLDERGVEWTSGDTEVSKNKYTHFCPDAGMSMGVWESGDGKLGIDAHTDYRFTPAQAIAATLGAGTCHDKGNIERFICSECGCRLDLQDDDWEANMWLDNGVPMVPRFCPNCGAKVVNE